MNVTESVKFIFLSLILLFTSSTIAQEKQKIAVEFFTGKWAGTISGYAHHHTHGEGATSRTINFSIACIWPSGLGGEAIIKPFGVKGIGHLMFRGGVAPNVPVVEKGKTYYVSPFISMFDFYFNESELVPVTDQYVLALWFKALIDYHKSNNRIDLNNNIIFINHKQEEKCPECSKPSEAFFYSGEIHRVDIKKLVFPKDIKPNEPIKTDKKTQLEITIPDVGKINVAPNTEAKIKCSVCWLEVDKGKIHGVIRKIEKKVADIRRKLFGDKFTVKTPTTAFSVRGTEYAVNVEDDGSTTVIVLDGEVEFSDKENKKTVIVKKNQKSVIKPGALPTEPENIDPEKILEWWK